MHVTQHSQGILDSIKNMKVIMVEFNEGSTF